MSHELIQSMTGIVTAIIGLAIFAVLLNSKGTGIQFVSAATGGLARDISAATAPVTGSFGGGFGASDFGTMGGSTYTY